MKIKKIHELSSNRDGYNFRIREHISKGVIGETLNIKLYNKATTIKDIANELKKGFKYGYNPFDGGWKHHPGIGEQSFFYEL